AGLGAGWPAGTVAALTVFTIAMLGVALSPPPPDTDAARPLRFTRGLVLVIGLAAGGAGLAGSLATRSLTLGTLAGAVGVGLTAALGGRTRIARILGWTFASGSAHLLVYVAGLALGLPSHWSAFGVLGVASLVLVTAATLPRLRHADARGEAPALEWSGYAGALLSLVLAGGSLRHVSALLAAWGAVLGIAALRPARPARQRRILLWSAVGCELAAWWLLMTIADVGLIEAYTLPFAALALLVGVIELRHHGDLGSWAAYGPALVAAFGPTLVLTLFTDANATRRIALLLGAVAILIAGSVWRQRAPVVVGGVVTTIAALHELFELRDWLIFIPIGILLLVLGATYEKRRRDLQRLRGALTRMR
ncbi:MAG TPA: permease, partial [Micromonosporaceae bacterium]|nr:permease [Micromonosporaceae bacterium]